MTMKSTLVVNQWAVRVHARDAVLSLVLAFMKMKCPLATPNLRRWPMTSQIKKSDRKKVFNMMKDLHAHLDFFEN